MLNILKDIRDKISDLPEDLRNKDMSSFYLQARTERILQSEEILTPNDFAACTNDYILRWNGFGEKSLNDLLKAFENYDRWPEANNKNNFYSSEPNKNASSNEGVSWFDEYFKRYFEYKAEFIELNIEDDKSFLAQKRNLPTLIGEYSEKFRFESLILYSDNDNPIECLNIAPDWLLEMDIDYFYCSARIRSLFAVLNITKLSELLKFTALELRAMPNTGSKSLATLKMFIISAIQKGPPPTKDNLRIKGTTLYGEFTKTLKKISLESHKSIIQRRLGLNGKIDTLEEIGIDLKITRERVRQIQKKSILKIINGEFWDDVLKYKLEIILNENDEPVFLDELSSNDSWFVGFENNMLLFKQVLTNFSHFEINFINIENKVLLSKLSEESWGLCRSNILDILENSLHLEYTLDDVVMVIDYELEKESVTHYSTLMYSDIEANLNYSIVENELVLSSLGNTIGSHLKSLLDEQSEPLHFSVIKQIYEDMFGVKTSERSIHARLSTGEFLLFNRGTYGNEKHLNFSEEHKERIVEFAEGIILANDEKQWDSAEILLHYNDASLDKYTLTLILKKSKKLTYLGKMIWVPKSASYEENDRLHVKKVVSNVLRSNGKPMEIGDIETEARKSRSMGENFAASLQPNELYSRIEQGVWGLLDRDFVLSFVEWEKIKVKLLEDLNASGVSMHTSELLVNVLGNGKHQNITKDHILGVLAADSRFRKWRGGLIGLANWKNANRLTLTEGIRSLIKSGEIEQDTLKIEAKLKEILGYEFEQNRIGLNLNKLGYSYDWQVKKWTTANN